MANNDKKKPEFGRLISEFSKMIEDRDSKNQKTKNAGEDRLTISDKIMLRQAAREIAMRTNGVSTTVTLQESVIMKVFETALSGKVYALRMALDLLEKAELKQQTEDQAYADYWSKVRQGRYQEIHDAKAAGNPEPKSYPHPDDIEISSDNEVIFHGPMTREDAKCYEDSAQDRDLFILQDNFELRKGVKPISVSKGKMSDASSPLLLATILNNALPKRYQLSKSEFMKQMMDADRYTKRELQKIIYKGLKTPRNNFKRGTVFAPLKTTKAIYIILEGIMKQHRDGEIDIETIPSEELTNIIFHSLEGETGGSQLKGLEG